jgi:hypothetical protein
MRYRLSDLAEHGRRDQIAAWQQRPADETER